METRNNFDPLTEARVIQTSRPIVPVHELSGLGVPLEDASAWAVCDPKQTSQFCRDILVHPGAQEGEVSRFEIYRDRDHPERCLCVLYRQFFREAVGRIVVENQFFTNDQGLRSRNPRYRSATPDVLRHILRP